MVILFRWHDGLKRWSDNPQFLSYIAGPAAVPGRSEDPDYGMEPPPPWKTPEDHAGKIIHDAEKSKAHMYEVSGRSVSIAKIDEDYQMINAHIDDALRRKVQGLEFVDFRKAFAQI